MMALLCLNTFGGSPFYFKTESKVSHVVCEVYTAGSTPRHPPWAPRTLCFSLLLLQDTPVVFRQGHGTCHTLSLTRPPLLSPLALPQCLSLPCPPLSQIWLRRHFLREAFPTLSLGQAPLLFTVLEPCSFPSRYFLKFEIRHQTLLGALPLEYKLQKGRNCS